MKRTLLMLALLSFPAFAQVTVQFTVPGVRVVAPPPPPRVEVQVARPSPNHIWIAGHWRVAAPPAPTVVYEPPPAPVQPVEVEVAPPAPIVEVRPAEPFTGAVWIPGYWQWNGAHHIWVGGRWSAPRAGWTWEPAHW